MSEKIEHKFFDFWIYPFLIKILILLQFQYQAINLDQRPETKNQNNKRMN